MQLILKVVFHSCFCVHQTKPFCVTNYYIGATSFGGTLVIQELSFGYFLIARSCKTVCTEMFVISKH